MSEGLLNENIFSKADQQNAKMTYEDARRYTEQVVNQAIDEERAVIFYERANPQEFVGYFSYHAHDYDNKAFICEGWKPQVKLESDLKKKYISTKKDPQNYWYGEIGYIERTARGAGIGGKFIGSMADYLHETLGAKGFYLFAGGVYIVNAMLKEGYELKVTIPLAEFEYNGGKPYQNIKPNKHFVNKIPAGYLLAKEYH